jgi:redox-sensitive bicupin YhaK (pirin superfamily)
MSAARSAPQVAVHRAAERFVTRTDWLHSAHSFSFGSHFDPANTSHGLLVVHNEDIVSPGGGFDTHRHADMEIITWVLSGALAHEDSTGRRGVLTPGVVQRMSAGSGVQHSERNASGDAGGEPVHFVQMWVVPDEPGVSPATSSGPSPTSWRTAPWCRSCRGSATARMPPCGSAALEPPSWSPA